MKKNKECIFIYSRKSKFTGRGESIGNQVELCREYIRMHYGGSAADRTAVYEDEGFSGGNLNRPAFKRMMDGARKGECNAIIVYRLDRISRNISDFAGLIEELSRLDIAFISIREQFDTGTPMGRAMMYIASVFSQLERETIAERIRDNMHELAKTGRWLGGTTPTGYSSESVKNVTVDGKTRKSCRLKLIPEQADIVKLIYHVFAETNSLTMTEAQLMKQGIKTKNGNYYSRFSVKAILQNPVYMIADREAYEYFFKVKACLSSDREAFDGIHGILAYNRTDQGKGRAAVYRPVREWIVAVGKHMGIISGREWIRVQETLERNKSKAYRRPRSNEALLTGLLYCSCGSRMYPKLSGRKTAEGKRIYTYVCKRKEHSKSSICDRKNVGGNALDMLIFKEIRLLEEDGEAFLDGLMKCRNEYTGCRRDSENKLTVLLKEKRETEKKIDALVDSLIDMEDGAAKNHVAKRIEELHGNCRSMEAEIRRLEEQTAGEAFNDAEFENMRLVLSGFKSSIDVMNVEQKRAALRTMVRKIVWDGASAHVVLCGAPELPMTHWGEDSK